MTILVLSRVSADVAQLSASCSPKCLKLIKSVRVFRLSVSIFVFYSWPGSQRFVGQLFASVVV